MTNEPYLYSPQHGGAELSHQHGGSRTQPSALHDKV